LGEKMAVRGPIVNKIEVVHRKTTEARRLYLARDSQI